jgi:hypothetical protein
MCVGAVSRTRRVKIHKIKSSVSQNIAGGKLTLWGHGDATGGLRASATTRPPAARASLCLSGVTAGCRRKKRRVGREVPGGSGSPSIRREAEQQPCRLSPVREDASGMG